MGVSTEYAEDIRQLGIVAVAACLQPLTPLLSGCMGWGVGESNIFKQTPGRLLLAFAITAGLIAVYTAVDASRRGYEEGYDFPTALGDDELFPVVEGAAPAPLADGFTVDGKPFYQQRRGALERHDKYMFKSGREDGDRFYVYRYRNRFSKSNRPDGTASPQGVYFVKIGERKYLEFADQPSRRQGGGEGARTGGG